MKKSSIFDLTRREFMAAGSVVAVTAGFGGFGRAALADCAGFGHQRAARLSIAYLRGSENWDYLRGLTPTLEAITEDMDVDEAPLIAADALVGGDSGFAARGARVTIHGLIAEPSDRLPAMLLKAHYRPYHEATHMAWGFEGSALCRAQPAASFTLPVHAGGGLQLSLEVWPRGGNTELTDPAIAEAYFGLGATPGEAKLRRGAYLMAWGLPGGPKLPVWSRYRAIAERIETPEAGMPETRRFMLTDATGAAKAPPAVMLTVDYSDAAAA